MRELAAVEVGAWVLFLSPAMDVSGNAALAVRAVAVAT
jgi:hypothetical protein